MNNTNIICLRCGTVQVRTDIEEEIQDRYIILKDKKECPKCKRIVTHIATTNIQNLRKQLEQNPNKKLDRYILKLIKRYFYDSRRINYLWKTVYSFHTC